MRASAWPILNICKPERIRFGRICRAGRRHFLCKLPTYGGKETKNETCNRQRPCSRGDEKEIMAYLEQKGIEVINVGTDGTESFHYPISGYRVAKLVASGEADGGF